nr:pepsin/retropepsin-like aspartic protease family protein [Sphingomicrobium nitratireducens]
MFLDARVNGVETRALLDSGAEVSILSPEFAARAGLQADGEATEARGTGAGPQDAVLLESVHVDALGLALEAPAAIIDLQDVSARLVGRPLDLIVGRSLFDRARLAIDIEGGTIALAENAIGPGTVLPLGEAQGLATIPARLGEVVVPALFDLGNGSRPQVSRALVDRLGLEVVGTETAGGIGGAHERDLVALPTLTLAGRTFDGLIASVDETDGDLINVGTSILRHYLIVTDFSAGWIRLDPRNEAQDG